MLTSEKSSAADLRKESILRAAFDVFATYGFKRTSMDDIAKAADISRPGLYQSFANKKEIFRAIVTLWSDDVCSQLEQATNEEMPLEQKLRIMFEKAVAEPVNSVIAMPHGEELFGLKNEYASDLFGDWRETVFDFIHKAFLDERGIDPAFAHMLAVMVDTAIAGMKADGLHGEALYAKFEAVLQIVAVSIQTKSDKSLSG
ncbi:MAG: TetR/AcrR family transcriptional regulator [Pseudomonadota bacterium]